MFLEIVNEEIDLLGESARLLHQLAEFGRDVFGDGLAEFLAVAKMLVGGAAIQPGALRDLDDGQSVGSPLREEVTCGGDQCLVGGLGVAAERSLAGVREQIPLRLVPQALLDGLRVRSNSCAH